MSKRRPAGKRQTASDAPIESDRQRLHLAFQTGITLLILSFFAYLLTRPINLATGDLGRHLKNGELFMQNAFIANTNLYAYTHPHHPFVNHHWGSGVVFYLVERAAGFHGLSLFFLTVSLSTLWLFFNFAVKCSSFALAAPLAMAATPVLISRDEIRPELFSYLLSGLFLKLLWDYQYRHRQLRLLFLLPLLQIFWVNLHIYFFIGMMLIGVFLVESLVALARRVSHSADGDLVRCQGLALIFLLTFLASCINPAGVYGALYPLFIFQGYEFPVIENYSVAAIVRKGFDLLPLVYFQILFGLLCLSWLYALVKDRGAVSLASFLLSVFFSAMAWWAIRNFTLFGYFALALTALNFKNVKRVGAPLASAVSMPKIFAAVSGVAILLVLINPLYFFSGRGGLGLEKGNQAAADFFRRENLQGPVFNNYDIGSYLIYHFYPRIRVFVDNRPEAYPTAFFNDDYFPLLLNNERWRNSSQAHHFNTIFLNHRARAIAEEKFIVRRVLDPDWAPVFFDEDIVILLRRYGPNQSVIAKHELPKEAVLRKAN
jgi:hypothetical protein